MADSIDIIVDDDDVVSVELSEAAAVEVTVEDPTPTITFTLAEAAGGGITQHNLLGGLAADDHPQYHNDARGDARYYTQSQLNSGQLDSRYFAEAEHIDSSAGAGDAGKPVKLNGDGKLDPTMVGPLSAAEISVTPFGTVTSTTVQDALEEIHNDLVIESGFENRTDSSISFTDGSRTFSIAPTGTSFSFWVQGEKYTKSSQQDLIISADEGLHYIYFDASGNLTETLIFSSAIISDFTFCAFVYWDATNSTGILFGDERHGRTMDASTHAYLHNIFSTQYDSGLALGNILADEDGSLATHIQCSISDGVIRDEDIRIAITDGSPQDLSPIAQLPILYRSGAAGDWRKIASTGYLVTTAGTGRAAYNQWTGATWQLTEVTNNSFTLTHIFATNDINHPMVIICGQSEYGNLSAAQAAALTEIESLASGPLDDAFPEWRAVATVIVQTSNGYSNAVKSRIRSTAEGDDYLDFRTTNISPAGGTNTADHGSLQGLQDDDHLIYALADGTRWTGTPGTNNLPRVDASGNLVSSDITFDGTNMSLGAGNNLQIPDLGAGSYLWIGTSLTNAGVLSFQTGSPNIFSIQAGLSRLALIGSNSITLQAGGGAVFTWPVSDGSANHVLKTDGSGGMAWADPTSLISAATDTTAGKVELATVAETDSGTDTGRAVTPDSLAGSYAGTKSTSIQFLADGATLATGSIKIPVPPSLGGMNLIYCNVYLGAKGSAGTSSFMLHNATDTVDMLTGNITLASGAGDGWTGPGTVDTANDDVAALDFIQLDIDAAATDAQGPGFLVLEFRLP